MASLLDTVKKNKPLVRGPGGQLSEESPEEIQKLAGNAGLAAPPTTAIGQGMIGANPDQQKMAGTDAQKTAALNLASQQPQGANLQDALRRQQVRSTATEGEEASHRKSDDMKNLGSLGDRVTDFINVQRQKLQDEAGKGVEVQSSTSFNGKDTTSIKDMLAQYRKEPNNQQLLLQLNQSLGYDINTQLSPAQVDQLYESAVQSIARGGAGDVDNDLNVQDLVANPNFGYDQNQLADLLGVSRDEIAKYTVGQLRDQVNKVQADEFNKTNQLEQQATSTNLGEAERGLARGAAMEASRTGQRASEADVHNLEGQIANADQVTFAGKTMNVDDLLKDDTISGIISEYMNSAPGSEIRNSIDQKEPGLRDFINKNQAVLADASQKMQAGAQTFTDTQTYNKKLQYEPFGGTKLDDNLAKLLIPGFGTLQSSKVDINSVPVLKLATEKGPQYGMQMANNINSEYKNDPTTADDLNGLDYDTAKAWDIGSSDPGSNWNTNYIAPKRFYEQLQRASPEDRDSLLKMAFKNAQSGDQVQGKLSDNRASNVLGFGSSINAGVADANGDGILDSGSDIRSALLSANPRPSLKGGPSSVKKYTPGDLAAPTVPSDGVDKAIYDKLHDAALKGSVNYEDLNKANLNIDEAIQVFNMSSSGKGNIDNQGAHQVLNKVRDANTDSGIGEAMKASDRNDQVNKLNALMNQDDNHINKDKVRSKLTELGAMSAADKAAQEEADRQRTGKRVAQQNELKTVLTGGAWAALPPETQEALNKMGTELGAGQLQQLKDTVKWDPNATVGTNVAMLARNVATLPGRQGIDAAQKLRDNLMDGTITKGIGGGLQSYGNQAADVVKNPGGAIANVASGGCFIAGTKFFLSDGSLLEVDKLTPRDTLLEGGRTIATAQFVCDEMYGYQGGIFVSGSHAVLENGKWVRVRDSENGTRYPELDGSIVYVVWNKRHRMVHESGTVFSDYSETDSTVAEIEEMRNIEHLNR